MQTVDDAGTPATDLEYAMHDEVRDRYVAAARLRARVMPRLDEELGTAIAHAIVGAWNTATLTSFLHPEATP